MVGDDYMERLRALEAAVMDLPEGETAGVVLHGSLEIAWLGITRRGETLEVQLVDHQGESIRPSDADPDPSDAIERAWDNLENPKRGVLPAFCVALMLAGSLQTVWVRRLGPSFAKETRRLKAMASLEAAAAPLRTALEGLVNGLVEPVPEGGPHETSAEGFPAGKPETHEEEGR